MARFSTSALAAMLALIYFSGESVSQEAAPPTADGALTLLKEGNVRFGQGKLAAKDIGAQRRAALAKGQHPFAVVLACADSRVAPELIFDQGLGDSRESGCPCNLPGGRSRGPEGSRRLREKPRFLLC